MTCWEILQIEKTTDLTQIRHSYAQLSKVYHPEREPQKFQELYKAYQEAVKYANMYQDDEGDFWDEDEAVEEVNFTNNFTNKFTNLMEKKASLKGKETEEAEEENNVFVERLYTHVSAEIKEGLDVFKEYFLQPGQKDWRQFMVTPSFLRVQFEEQFAAQLAEFFKNQTVFVPEELPFNLVRELFFTYESYMTERGEEFFEDGFTKLFALLYSNQQIELVLEDLAAEKYLNQRTKYHIYYAIYKRVIQEKDTQSIDVWEFYMYEIQRGAFGIGENKRLRDDLIFDLLAFVISEAPEFSEKVYEYLIRRLELIGIKNTNQWQLMGGIYQAIESKGIEIEEFEEKVNKRPEQIRTLMTEIKKWKQSRVTEADREGVRAFLEGELYSRYALDHDFLKNLYYFCMEGVIWSQIFLEEYVSYYDKVYEKNNTLEGRELYHLMKSRMQEESTVGEDYTEIAEERKEWVLRYFFEEGFSRVWKSFTLNTMKPIYRTLLVNHLENLAQEQNYEWDLCEEGHLYAIKDGKNYVFMYDRINEKAILSMEEYWLIMEEMLNIFTERYFCLSSDKNKWMELLERARKNIWQA